MKCWDCLIVGAGPSGGMAALTVARAGRSVLVLEKGDAVGLPVHCGEAVSRDAFTRNGLTPDPAWIAREVHEARMVTPNGKTIRFHEAGYCIRRDRFDRWLNDRAQQAGAELKVGCRVTHARKDGRQWIVKAAEELYQAAVLVMAGGAAGRIEGIASLRPPPVTLPAMQYKFKNRPEVRRDALEFHHGEHFHPGYGWIFDRGSEVSIGMAGRQGLAQRLRSFCAAHGFDHRERISAHSGPIPLWQPCARFRHGELLWVGDAAGLVHPITRGGIHLALQSGRMAGEAIVEALQGRQPERLGIYQERMRELVRPLRKSWRQSRWLYALPDRVWNVIGELMDGRRFDALPFQNLPMYLVRNPWMLPYLLRFHDLQSHYRKTITFAW